MRALERSSCCPAEPVEGAVLDHAQDLLLERERHVADLVEEQRPARRPARTCPAARWSAPVNAPRSWPNSSLSSSVSGKAAQLTATNGRSPRPDAVVDRARDELLAGAALARRSAPAAGCAPRARRARAPRGSRPTSRRYGSARRRPGAAAGTAHAAPGGGARASTVGAQLAQQRRHALARACRRAPGSRSRRPSRPRRPARRRRARPRRSPGARDPGRARAASASRPLCVPSPAQVVEQHKRRSAGARGRDELAVEPTTSTSALSPASRAQHGDEVGEGALGCRRGRLMRFGMSNGRQA